MRLPAVDFFIGKSEFVLLQSSLAADAGFPVLEAAGFFHSRQDGNDHYVSHIMKLV